MDELKDIDTLKRQEVWVLHASEIDDDLLSEIENAQYGVIWAYTNTPLCPAGHLPLKEGDRQEASIRVN